MTICQTPYHYHSLKDLKQSRRIGDFRRSKVPFFFLLLLISPVSLRFELTLESVRKMIIIRSPGALEPWGVQVNQICRYLEKKKGKRKKEELKKKKEIILIHTFNRAYPIYAERSGQPLQLPSSRLEQLELPRLAIGTMSAAHR